jgi:hypothetical protein
LLFGFILLFTVEIVSAKCLKPTPLEAATADVLTTAVALSRGATELNPLGFAGSTVAKGVLLITNEYLNEADKKILENAASSLWGGAAVNNLLVIFGVATMIALPVGVLSMIIIANMDDCKMVKSGDSISINTDSANTNTKEENDSE